MHPTIDLDFVELPVYSVLIALGAGVGLAAAFLHLRRTVQEGRALLPAGRALFDFFQDCAVLVFAAGWVGARAYHVLTHLDFYAARPDQILQWGALPGSPFLGGLGLRGAFLAGGIVLAVYARVRRFSFWPVADAAALGLAAGQAIGWIGALAEGANYGAVSDSRWAVDWPDLYGLVQPRWPVQHLEIGFFAVLFLFLVRMSMRKPPPGRVFLVFLLITSVSQVALGALRGDETAYVGPVRVDQIVDAGLGLLALAGLFRQKFKSTTRSASPVTRTRAWKVT